MVNTNAIITEYENRQVFLDAIKSNNSLLIIKFKAKWCRPCRKINELISDYFATMPYHVSCADIDVDENFDVYAYLKSKKMVRGLPVILCYKGENNMFAPDDAVEGADEKEIDDFFKRCRDYLKN